MAALCAAWPATWAAPSNPNHPPALQLSHQSEEELELKGKAVKAFAPYYPIPR
jgi:hypothetical protein